MGVPITTGKQGPLMTGLVTDMRGSEANIGVKDFTYNSSEEIIPKINDYRLK